MVEYKYNIHQVTRISRPDNMPTYANIVFIIIPLFHLMGYPGLFPIHGAQISKSLLYFDIYNIYFPFPYFPKLDEGTM